MTSALRFLRSRLHARAYDLSTHGHHEAAQALWAIVDELDALLNRLGGRRG